MFGSFGSIQSAMRTPAILVIVPNFLKYYTFNSADVSGTLLANIASGAAVYDATLSVAGLAITSDSKFGNGSLSFTGDISQFVTLSSINTTSVGLSVSFWVKGTSSPSGSCLFDIGNGDTNNNIVASIGTGTNNLMIAVYNSATPVSINTTQTVLNGTWMHVVWTMATSPSAWKLYINSVDTAISGTTFYPNQVSRTVNYIGKTLIASMSTPGLGPNLILNGSFELPLQSANSFTDIISITLTNWTVVAPGYLLNNSTVFNMTIPYPDVSQCYAFYGPVGSISQTVSLTPGTYKLSWYMAGRPGYASLSIRYDIIYAGTSYYSGTYPYTGSTVWTLKEPTFTTTFTGTHTVKFSGYSAPDNFQTIALDKIQLNRVITTNTPLTAKIDDFRVYNSVLTQTDVNNVYAGGI